MITTLYYYNHYKPYMFKSDKANSLSNIRKSKEAPVVTKQSADADGNVSNKKLLLNKALNKDVVSYAHDVSYNLISLKDAAKYVNYDIEDFNYKTRKYGYKETKDTLKEDLNQFVSSFNKAYSFYSSQGHSQSLVDFSVRMDNTIALNSDKLSTLGINVADDSKLSFDAETYDSLSKEALSESMGTSDSVFKSVYGQSSSMLSVPLSDHMNFKSLNYYYNYKYGGVVADTFKIIEAGMIIDEVV